MIIRDLVEDDVPALTAIYNELIATTDVIWLEEPVTVADRLAWLRGLRPDDAALAAEGDDGTLLGYAAIFPFRTKSGYWPTVELTIMLRADYRGDGIGQALMDELARRASSAGRCVMVAGIDGGNAGSIRFHERNGFRQVASMPGIGSKHDRRLDLVLMQRDLPADDPGGAA
ncbi:GNAT family N-acetyltransferase [Aquihabitans daechungensis]|uniref:GNAT family N-acetyltransferase n=1 Tax=Aquihabitans daechungensis TaxID=1052257 RepID=UPI003BA1DA8F